jgi:hypothetical protein
MRSLWPIEKAAIEAAIMDFPAHAVCIRRQAESALVRSFVNTGKGFFSGLLVSEEAPILTVRSPLDCAHGAVNGVDHAMGFLAFIEDGRLSTIEGYCLALDSTEGIDFETVDFELRPYSAGYD